MERFTTSSRAITGYQNEAIALLEEAVSAMVSNLAVTYPGIPRSEALARKGLTMGHARDWLKEEAEELFTADYNDDAVERVIESADVLFTAYLMVGQSGVDVRAVSCFGAAKSVLRSNDTYARYHRQMKRAVSITPFSVIERTFAQVATDAVQYHDQGVPSDEIARRIREVASEAAASFVHYWCHACIAEACASA